MFKLKVRNLDFSTGGVNIVVLNQKFAIENDLHPMDRVLVAINSKKRLIASIDISSKIVNYDEVNK